MKIGTFKKKYLFHILLSIFLLVQMVPGGITGMAATEENVAGVQLQGVTYKFKPNVEPIPTGVNISYSEDGYKFMFKDTKGFNPQKGKIYVDMKSKVAFQLESDIKKDKGVNIADISFADLEDILEDLNIPEQSLELTPGNIDKSLNIKNIKYETQKFEKEQTKSSDQTGTKSSTNEVRHEYAFKYKFNDLFLFEKSSDSGAIVVTATGEIMLTKPTIIANFKWNDKFKISFEASEYANIEITGTVTLKEEIKVLIGGFEVPFVIGKVYCGIYLVLGVDGKITVLVEVEQGVDIKTSMDGKLTWGIIPYDVRYDCDIDNTFNVSASYDAYIKTRAAVVPSAGITVLGYNLLDLSLWLGLEAEVAKQSTGGVTTNVDAFFKIVGWIFDEPYTIYEDRWPIYTKTSKELDKVFNIQITKVCAYENMVEGNILKQGKNYTGTLTVFVKNKSGKLNQYIIQCSDGYFSCKKPILGTDNVWVEIKDNGKTYKSEQLSATIPFVVYVTMVDAFNDVITGMVSPKYTGPVTVVVQTVTEKVVATNLGGTGKNTVMQNISNKTFTAQCTDGLFTCNVVLNGNDNVTAKITYEGLEKISSTVSANLPLRINLKADNNGTYATIQNINGDKPYIGDCKVKISTAQRNTLNLTVKEYTESPLPYYGESTIRNYRPLTSSSGFLCEEAVRPPRHELVTQSIVVSITYKGITISESIVILHTENLVPPESPVNIQKPMERQYLNPMVDPLITPLNSPVVFQNSAAGQ